MSWHVKRMLIDKPSSKFVEETIDWLVAWLPFHRLWSGTIIDDIVHIQVNQVLA